MRGWLAASLLLLALVVSPALAQAVSDAVPSAPLRAPIEQWTKGDWWEVQLEQPTLYMASAPVVWTTSFRLHLTVTDLTDQGARVEVTTIPENRLQQRLVLTYTQDGKVDSAQVVQPGRSEPLGPGTAGIFGMLGRDPFDLSQAPRSQPAAPPDGPVAAPLASVDGDGLVRVSSGTESRSAQYWEPGGAFWKRLELSDDLPQRATLVEAHWRQRQASVASESR